MTKGIIIASTDDFAPYFSSSDGTEAGSSKGNGSQRHAKKMRSGVSRAWDVMAVIGRTTKHTADQKPGATIGQTA